MVDGIVFGKGRLVAQVDGKSGRGQRTQKRRTQSGRGHLDRICFCFAALLIPKKGPGGAERPQISL